MSNNPANDPGSIAQLLGKSWDELEILEHSGRILFPVELRKITKDGKVESIPVRLMVPREPELRKARVQARQMAIKDGLDLDRDKDLIDNLEVTCILSIAIRSYEPMKDGYCEPFEPDASYLEEKYDKDSLISLYEMLEDVSAAINPRLNKITTEEMFVLLAAIAKRRDISPLAVLGPGVQTSFIVTMADQLLSCMAQKSLSDASAPLTQG